MMPRLNISSGGPFEPVFGYSRAVRVGNQIHVSGTTARPPDDEKDAYGQAIAAMKIIGKALDDAGASFSDVVRTVVYVTDMADADKITRAHREVFGDIRPASTLVAVAALLQPSHLVEIEAYAIVE